MNDNPVILDHRRGMAAQRATEIRRSLAEVEAQHAALRERQADLEQVLLSAASASWEEAAHKARYLIGLFAETLDGQDPRRKRIIEAVLDDFHRLSGSQSGIDGAP
jgi:hypothetical protein